MRRQVAPTDVLAWRNYSETYDYDLVGNLESVVHTAGAGSWTRTYDYVAGTDRLHSTTVGAQTFTYEHHAAHGFITAMPHLSHMAWSPTDELRCTATQRVTVGTPERTWYVYDSEGKRVRKVTESAAAPGASPTVLHERYYVDDLELWRRYNGGGAVQEEHRTTRVADDKITIALVEVTERPAGAVTGLIRYQCPNHLASSHVETDTTGRVLSYELYHPYGTSAYQATDSTIAAAAKRYRYTGMERDDESGLEYHSARYYAPWLGRWLAPDAEPEKLRGNRYVYVGDNPVSSRDPGGRFEESIHGVATYRLALAAGFTQSEAAQIALANAGMDHNPDTEPGTGIDLATQMIAGNTTMYHYPTQQDATARVQREVDAVSPTSTNLHLLGEQLHSLQDVGWTGLAGPHNRGPLPGARGEARRSLQSDLVFLGGFATAFAGVLIGSGVAALGDDQKALGWTLIGFGILFALVATVAFLVGAYAGGIGHPDRVTEQGAESTWTKKVADQAFRDPTLNREMMRRTFRLLREAARNRGRSGAVSEDEAMASIEDVFSADSFPALQRFAEGRVSFRGETYDAYSTVVDAAYRVGDKRTWRSWEMDLTVGPDIFPDTYRDWRCGRTPALCR